MPSETCFTTAARVIFNWRLTNALTNYSTGTNKLVQIDRYTTDKSQNLTVTCTSLPDPTTKLNNSTGSFLELAAVHNDK